MPSPCSLAVFHPFGGRVSWEELGSRSSWWILRVCCDGDDEFLRVFRYGGYAPSRRARCEHASLDGLSLEVVENGLACFLVGLFSLPLLGLWDVFVLWLLLRVLAVAATFFALDAQDTAQLFCAELTLVLADCAL